MRSNAEGDMNVARPHICWRIGGWIAPLLFSFAIIACLLEPAGSEQFASPGEKLFTTALFLAFGFGSVLFLLIVYRTYYTWDDEEIRHRFLWRERSMRWDDVVAIGLRRLSKESYVLSDASGARLTVDFEMRTTGGGALYRALAQKLARLQEQELRELEHDVTQIESAEETRFPIGRASGCFVVRGDYLAHTSLRRSCEVSLADVRYIYRRDLKAEGGVTLVSNGSARIHVPADVKRYGVILAYVRRRARNAIWIDTRGPAPITRAERMGYLQWKAEGIRNIGMFRTGRWLVALCCAGFVAFFAWLVHTTGPEDDFNWSHVAYIACVLSVVNLGLFAWSASLTRRLRRLEARLAQLEAGEDEEGTTLTAEEE